MISCLTNWNPYQLFFFNKPLLVQWNTTHPLFIIFYPRTTAIPPSPAPLPRQTRQKILVLLKLIHIHTLYLFIYIAQVITTFSHLVKHTPIIPQNISSREVGTISLSLTFYLEVIIGFSPSNNKIWEYGKVCVHW